MKTVFNLSATFDKNAFMAAVDKFASAGDVVKLERIPPPRTNSQNRYYWALVAILSDFTGYESDEVHNLCIEHYAPEYTRVSNSGKENTFKLSTSKMDTKQMTDYINSIRTMGDRIGCYLPTADEFRTNWQQIEKLGR